MNTPNRIVIDLERIIGKIDPRIFGGFLEHMGRAIYQGIYEPGSPLSDGRGFRKDVMKAVNDLGPTIIRYPGGNALSGYHWEDGVGPREQRPRKREMAWRSIETNQFGINEFLEYCSGVQALPMLGVNLGTGTIEEASALVEYCNAPAGTIWSDLRARHGYSEPHDVKHWCLGNEMDGPWQIGHLEAADYARKALEAAKLMKWHDPSIQLILCGSSGTEMPTYPEWDRVALEIGWKHIDYLSLHYYADNHADDTPSFLASASQFENHIDTLASTLRYVKAKLRSNHDVYLSWDEWNVWYKDMTLDGNWQEAPHLIEEVYNLEDALVVAQWLNVFLRRCDVLKIACIAQLVNIIAPILTRTDGILLQSIYYPFQLFRRYASGNSLDVLCVSPQYETKRFGPMPVLDVSASYQEESGNNSIFIVNRNQTAPEAIEIEWRAWKPGKVTRVIQVSGTGPKQANTFENPNNIVPREIKPPMIRENKLRMEVPPLSFTTLTVSGDPG